MSQKNDRSTFASFNITGYELFDKYEPYPNKIYITIDIYKFYYSAKDMWSLDTITKKLKLGLLKIKV